ncbi:MAG: hypothetical protein SFX19_10370 [Alphaproteobacteria bacterium]|nr:hypothetical protein [Alphaproteobacteria bacterium]
MRTPILSTREQGKLTPAILSLMANMDSDHILATPVRIQVVAGFTADDLGVAEDRILHSSFEDSALRIERTPHVRATVGASSFFVINNPTLAEIHGWATQDNVVGIAPFIEKSLDSPISTPHSR